MEPHAAASETKKQRKLRVLNNIHLPLNFSMFFCAMYISVGKYTVSGQKLAAPRNPSMSLKNGIKIAKSVASATKILLQINLNMLTLNLKLFTWITVSSLFRIFRFGFLLMTHFSTAAKTG